MKHKQQNKYIIPLLVLIFIGAALFFMPKDRTEAAGLSNAYAYLSRIKAGEVSGVEMTFVIAPSAATSGSDSIDIVFPDGEDGQWCNDTGGTSLISSVDMTGFQNTVETTIVSLPGTLTASCTTGAGAGSYDTITISGINALTSSNIYGVTVSDSQALLGTATVAGNHVVNIDLIDGANLQSFSLGVNLIADDQVVVTATVSDAPTVTCSLSTTTLSLGTLFRGGSYASASHTFTAYTSANANGYYVAAWGTGDGSTDAGLWKSSATTYLIASPYTSTSGATTTIDLGTNEGYGIKVTDPDGGGTAQAVGDFSSGTASVYGTIGNTESDARILYYKTSAETTPANGQSTVTHAASAGAGPQVSLVNGDYQETVTFMCGGFY